MPRRFAAGVRLGDQPAAQTLQTFVENRPLARADSASGRIERNPYTAVLLWVDCRVQRASCIADLAQDAAARGDRPALRPTNVGCYQFGPAQCFCRPTTS